MFSPPRRLAALFTTFCAVALLALALQAPPARAHAGHADHAEHAEHATQAAFSAAPLVVAEHGFELAARLATDELSVLIDERASNAPLLFADLWLDFAGARYPASFRAASGDYAFSAPPLLAALQHAGEKDLVFTLHTSGSELRFAGHLDVHVDATASHAAKAAAPRRPEALWLFAAGLGGLVAGWLLRPAFARRAA